MTGRFLDRILARYAGTFDLTRPYTAGDRTYAAYGYFFKKDEHYVALKRVTLWSFHQTEHVLFAETARADRAFFQDMDDTAKRHIEPALIRKHEKYPPKDHMESLVTLVVISEKTPDEETIAEIRRYRFFRSYLFHFRGHTRGQALLVDLEKGVVTTSRDAKYLKKLYEDTLRRVTRKTDNPKVVDFPKN